MNRPRIEALKSDLDLALTIAAQAASFVDGDNRNRYRAHALEIFLFLRDQLWPLCSPKESERAEIELKLRKLRDRLEQLGGRPRLRPRGTLGMVRAGQKLQNLPKMRICRSTVALQTISHLNI